MTHKPDTQPEPSERTGLPDGAPQPELLDLHRNSRGELVARLSDRPEEVEDVRIARCLPWSMPDQLVSLRDKEGQELLLLETLETLPPRIRETIEAELHDKVFAPQITRVLKYEDQFGVMTVEAQTDRGLVTFQLRHRDDIRPLSATRWLLKDVDGNIYEIHDTRELDPESRKHLAEFL